MQDNSTTIRRPRHMVKKLAIGAGALIAAVVISTAVMLLAFNMEKPGDIRTLNAVGTTGTALIAYHPGGSHFQEDAITAFAEVLVDAGWVVDITTLSSETPADLSAYDLIVLGAPVYAGSPAKPFKAYLERVGDLQGKPTVAIISGQGATAAAEVETRSLIEESNGDLVKLLPLWTSAPNEEMYGISDPAEIMKREAGELVLPR